MRAPAVIIVAQLLLCAALAQQSTPVAAPPALELPARLSQKVEAGKTPVGTTIKAKLEIATLIEGQVVPKNAVLFGHVEESQARTSESPSRLSVLIDSLRWNSGEIKLTAYLSNTYHPVVWTTDADKDALHGMQASTDRRQRRREMLIRNRTEGRMDTRPADQRASEELTAAVAANRIPMPHVVAANTSRGLTLTCKDHNIKLDKSTVYGFEGIPLQAAAQNRQPR